MVSQSDGYRPECKECRKAYSRAYHERNASQIRAKVKRWKAENRQHAIEYGRRWRKENVDKKRAIDKRWYDANRERVAEYATKPIRRAYARVNAKNQKAKRKAAAGATVEQISLAEWAALQAEYSGLCVYCHTRPEALTMDHVVPLIDGGSHTKDNIVPACGRCNREKSTRSLVEYLIARRAA